MRSPWTATQAEVTDVRLKQDRRQCCLYFGVGVIDYRGLYKNEGK